MKNDNLNDFQNYLISKSAVNEKNAPYYVRWVSSCYTFVNQPLSDVFAHAPQAPHLPVYLIHLPTRQMLFPIFSRI